MLSILFVTVIAAAASAYYTYRPNAASQQIPSAEKVGFELEIPGNYPRVPGVRGWIAVFSAEAVTS
jgi:hypothetical protein